MLSPTRNRCYITPIPSYLPYHFTDNSYSPISPRWSLWGGWLEYILVKVTGFRWLDTGQVHFCVFIDWDGVNAYISVHKHKERTRPISHHLTKQACMVNKLEDLLYEMEHYFLAGHSTIPSGNDSAILPSIIYNKYLLAYCVFCQVRCTWCHGSGHRTEHRDGQSHRVRCTWCHGSGRRT